MIEPRVLAQGPFAPEQITVTVHTESNQLRTPAMEECIEREWARMTRDAEERGKALWNGVTQRANAVAVTEQGVLQLELAPLDFKHRECVLAFPGYYDLPEVYWRKGVYVSAFVQTSDGWYVFVRLSGRSTNNNFEECVGGVVGDELVVRTGQDLYRSFEIELEQETAVPSDAIQENMLMGLYVGPDTNVGCHFETTLKDTRREVEQRFQELGGDQVNSSLNCNTSQTLHTEYAS